VVFVDIWEDLRVFLAISDGASGLNDVRTLRIVVTRVLLKLLGEGNRSLEWEVRDSLLLSS
jgi:hypothetical protein